VLVIEVILNSAVADVIGFKCCNLPDLTLELHVKNTGETEARLSGQGFEMEDAEGRRAPWNLYPPWEQVIAPGASAAFYAAMDEAAWSVVRVVHARDREGEEWRWEVNGEG
jgi:hypothetical protein